MKKPKVIDYKQRPASYWQDDNVLASLLRDVKGTKRRRLIEQFWKDGKLDAIPEELLKTSLSDSARNSLGRVHPAFMGGEYLPDYGAEETEIARLELRSTTRDVISIRARREGKLIGYSIVDEYGSEFELQRQSSEQPLTLGELVAFIDGSRHPELSEGLATGYNEMNAPYVEDRASLQHFTTVRSDFYPQLQVHYERVFAEWVAERKAEDEEEEEEE